MADPFTSGFKFGSNLIAGQSANRERNAQREERRRLRDLGADMSLGVEQGFLAYDKETKLYTQGPRFNENSPVINEIRNRIINLSPAFQETLKFDGDKQGMFAGETSIGDGKAVLNTDTGNGIKQITLDGTSNQDDQIVVVDEGFSNSMADLALLDLNLDLDPTSIQRSQLARNIQEQERVPVEQQKEILDILSTSEISRGEKTLLLADYYEETQQADDPVPDAPDAPDATDATDATDAPASSTTDRRKTGRTATVVEVKSYSERKKARQIDIAQGRLDEAQKRLENADPESNVYKVLKSKTIPKLQERLEGYQSSILEGSVATSNKGEGAPDPATVIQDSEAVKQEFLQELEGKSLDDLTNEQQELIRTDRVNAILKKYDITNINQLSQNNKIKISELRAVGVSLARQIAITEARRLGNTDMTSIGNYAQNAYTAIWGGIVAGDMNLDPQKLAEHQLKLEQHDLKYKEFFKNLETDNLTRSEAAAEDIGTVAELLFTKEDGTASFDPRDPEKIPKLRKKLITMQRKAELSLRKYKAGTATSADYDTIRAFKDAMLLSAKSKAFINRDPGFWQSFLEIFIDTPDLGQRDLDVAGAYYSVESLENGNFDFGNSQIFTRSDMQKLFGDKSAETLRLIIEDDRLQRNIQEVVQRAGANAEQ